MPLLEIATPQPSFQNHIRTLRPQTLLHNKNVFGNEKSLIFGWKSFQVGKKGKEFNVERVGTRRSVIVIRAVATVEPKCSVQSNGGHEGHNNLRRGVDSGSTSGIEYHSATEEGSEELDEREKLRRTRISVANKGNTPWNKGRKHSEETIQRISERTRIAMQNPKVRMKLANLGHAQSDKTRMKIGAGVRLGWKRRRERLMLQETCYFDWQNLIAEASRQGFYGEEELQWDSYEIMDDQLEQEWLDSVEQRRTMRRPKGSKRAPKSLEQRRKISEAISAKWADAAYRDKVCSALSKYHGTPVGAERKLRRRPTVQREPRTKSPVKKNAKENVTKSQKHPTRLRKSKMPLYKDPLASSKLQMIENIRARRAATETKKAEAIEQAKLLIAEAEKAAKALEAAAMTSPIARASLNETRKLIAEAVQSLQSIESGQIYSQQNDPHPSVASAELVNHAENDNILAIQGMNQTDHGKINGTQAVDSCNIDIEDFGFGEFNLQDFLKRRDEVLPSISTGDGLLNGKSEVYNDYGLPTPGYLSSFTEQLSQLEPNGKSGHEKEELKAGPEFEFEKDEKNPKPITVNKKWVRGRLVEVVEED